MKRKFKASICIIVGALSVLGGFYILNRMYQLTTETPASWWWPEVVSYAVKALACVFIAAGLAAIPLALSAIVDQVKRDRKRVNGPVLSIVRQHGKSGTAHNSQESA